MFSGTVAQNVDALATAPYFGYAVPDTFTLDQLFTEITTGGLVTGGYPGGMIAQVLSYAASDYSVASAAGLPLIAYEGGQSLVAPASDTTLQNLYAAANRDPRMGAAYTTFLTGWNLGGQLFVNYSDVSAYTQWGYWGALNISQSHPRLNILDSTGFISNNSRWWSGCATAGTSTTATPTVATPAVGTTTTPPSAPTGLAATVASATQINLTWTASTGTVTGYNVSAWHEGGHQHQYVVPNSKPLAATTYTYTASAYNAAGNTLLSHRALPSQHLPPLWL